MLHIYIYIYIYDIFSLRVNVLPMLKLLNTMKTFTPLTVFPIESFITDKSVYMEPVQGLNLNC